MLLSRPVLTVLLLGSNVFMTCAWCYHLNRKG